MTTPTPPSSTPPARTPITPPGTGMAMVSGSGRLGQGELRRRVAAHLAATPGAHTPGAIARALGRSAGAVGNALDTLVAHGHAEQVTSHPRRYRRTATTASAATTPAPSPPRRARTTAPSPTRGASARPAAPQGSPAPAPTTPSAPGAVRRPNGQPYHPRLLAELPDVTALRKLRQAGIPALLYGPPGTGKTSLVEAAFDDLITVAGDGDTTVADFVGEYTQASGGGYEFIYGPLVTAMSEGRALFIDDATLISPKVLAVVYPAMKAPEFVITEMPVAGTRLRAGSSTVLGAHVRVGLSLSTRCCRPMGDLCLSPRVNVSALSISIGAR
jgi:nitric oxide reductase NorQ protein